MAPMAATAHQNSITQGRFWIQFLDTSHYGYHGKHDCRNDDTCGIVHGIFAKRPAPDAVNNKAGHHLNGEEYERINNCILHIMISFNLH